MPNNKLSEGDMGRIDALTRIGYGAADMIKVFPEKKWNRKTVQSAMNRLKKNGGDTAPKLRTGRPRMITDEIKEEMVQRALSPEGEPRSHESQREISKATGFSLGSVNAALKEQLWCAKKLEVHRLEKGHADKRFHKTRALLARFPTPESTDRIVFLDEKNWEIEHCSNRQNDRVYIPHGTKKYELPPERILLPRDSFGKHVMALVAVSSRGPLFCRFFEQDERSNSKTFLEILQDEMIPAIRIHHPDGFTLQMDGSTSHTAKIVQNYLTGLKKKSTQEFQFDFIAKDEWPAKSPDLNVCDYRVFAHQMQLVYDPRLPRMKTINEVKARVRESFESLSPALCQSWTREFVKRLKLVIREKGGNIEQFVNKI